MGQFIELLQWKLGRETQSPALGVVLKVVIRTQT